MRRTLIALPLLLAGCAGTVPDAPSLLPRPIESRGDAEPAAPAANPADTVDTALDAETARRVAAFDAAARAFSAAERDLAARIGRGKGAAEGSDRWLDGQAAIGELQQLRTATDSAMVDIEALAIERASAAKLPYPALEAAIAAAQAELDRQIVVETRFKAEAGA
ncbi:hypothetical protein [Sphingomonas sp.]|uniref:hypothetical protein n=1 Tax=Sphingomonas sp. TaxID=28214 RepID=UPI002DD65D56|nr:hypothetical protein [Sphingomonas sp.]